MPKQVDAHAQRREIRGAARRVFARRGVRGTGLSHVAREVGMGRSSLYHYYSDKDALLRDLVRTTLEQEGALFRDCLRAPGTALERVHRLLDALLETFEEWASVGRMQIEFRVRDARFRRFFRNIRDELATALEDGQAHGEIDAALDPQLGAATLIGAIDGLLLQYFIDAKAFDLDALAVELRRVASRMLAP